MILNTLIMFMIINQNNRYRMYLSIYIFVGIPTYDLLQIITYFYKYLIHL